MSRGVKVGIVAAGGGILIASFLPWIALPADEGSLFTVLPSSTAWNTSVGENVFNLPNWLIPATALLIAFLHLMAALPETEPPRRLQQALCISALAQLLWFAISISSWALPGQGAFVTLVLLLYILSQSFALPKLASLKRFGTLVRAEPSQ